MFVPALSQAALHCDAVHEQMGQPGGIAESLSQILRAHAAGRPLLKVQVAQGRQLCQQLDKDRAQRGIMIACVCAEVEM